MGASLTALLLGSAVAVWSAPACAQSTAAAEARFDIDAIDVDGNTLLDQKTLQRALYPHMGPGRTTADVEAAQKDLQAVYRARGYQSVVVEVPRQSVSDRVIRIHVAEAAVGRLRVVGSKYHSPEALEAAVPALAEGSTPNFTQAQAQIDESNRLPDRQTTPVVRAGEVPGTVDVDLQVTDQEPLHGSLELNNDAGPFTTPLRLSANLHYDNLWQLGHSLSVTYAAAPDRLSDSEVFAGSYVAPIWGTPFSILAYGYDSKSDLATIGGVDVLSPGYAIGLRGVYQFPTIGHVSQSLSFGLDYKSFKEVDRVPSTDQNGAPITAITGGTVDYTPLNFTYTLRRQAAATTVVSVSLTANLRGVGFNNEGFQTKRAFAEADFIHLNLDVDHTQPLWGGFQIDLRLSGQSTNTPLVSSEQFAAGGLSSVRGYLEAEAVGDDGAFGSVELRSPILLPKAKSWLGDLRLYSFLDGAHLWVLKPLADQTGAYDLSSTGVGARLKLLDHLTGDINLAYPLKDGPFRKAGGRAYPTFSVKSDF
jgi:hemolysin activation/secretion protein